MLVEHGHNGSEHPHDQRQQGSPVTPGIGCATTRHGDKEARHGREEEKASEPVDTHKHPFPTRPGALHPDEKSDHRETDAGEGQHQVKHPAPRVRMSEDTPNDRSHHGAERPRTLTMEVSMVSWRRGQGMGWY